MGQGVIGAVRLVGVAPGLEHQGIGVEFRPRAGIGHHSAGPAEPREGLRRIGRQIRGRRSEGWSLPERQGIGGGLPVRRGIGGVRPVLSRVGLGPRLPLLHPQPGDRRRSRGCRKLLDRQNGPHRDQGGRRHPGQPQDRLSFRPGHGARRPEAFHPRPGHRKGVDRFGDVLHWPFAEIDERHGEPAHHGVMHGAGDADAARLGEMFEPSRDIDRHAQKIAVALDHVADGDAHAELQPAARRQGQVAGPQGFLNVDGGSHGVDRAFELAHDGVAGRVEDAPMGSGHDFDEDVPVGGQPLQSPVFVLGDQAREAGDVGGKDGRDLAFHGRLS